MKRYTPMKSPVARKLYDNSASPRSQSEECYTGYITHVADMETTVSGNKYFDVRLKVGENETIIVRVMSHGNEYDVFSNKKKTPVSLYVKLSNRTIFFNKKYGARIEDKMYELDFSNELVITDMSWLTLSA